MFLLFLSKDSYGFLVDGILARNHTYTKDQMSVPVCFHT